MVGANFRFGSRAAGDVATLREAGESRDFVAEGIPLDGGPQVWSSTYVRTCLAAGDVAGAAEALGRPFTVRGVVVQRRPARPRARLPDRQRADRRRDRRSAPTACTPGGCGGCDTGETFPAAISVGTNPTFDGERERRVESYVLDRDDLELYGVEVEVAFVDRLRGMVAFDSVEKLVEQMHDDVDRARELLALMRLPPASRWPTTEAWFLQHGLPYFVPEERAGARSGAAARPDRPAGARRRAGGVAAPAWALALVLRRVQLRARRAASPSACWRRSGTP